MLVAWSIRNNRHSSIVLSYTLNCRQQLADIRTITTNKEYIIEGINIFIYLTEIYLLI